MGIERREHLRQRVSRVEVRVASREAFRASYLRDLSMGGLFIRSRHPLPAGSQVVVELAVANRERARLRGEVVRQELAPDGTPHGFGVRFSTLDPETQSAVEAIIREHQQPEPESVPLEVQLAEARGTIEAYEQSLALMRESESEMMQSFESAAAERDVLAEHARELQTRVQSLEREGASLRAHVSKVIARLAVVEDELEKQRAEAAQLNSALQLARGLIEQTASEHEQSVQELESARATQSAEDAARRGEFEAELSALKTQLALRDDTKLRAELQEFSAQLDDERLKSMALERALQRFVAMGGVIPPRSE